jgi:transcriptional regulator with XRE-family HTH domain
MVFTMIQAVPLTQMIGARLRQLREAARLRQEQIAAASREAGFLAWTRGTVAMVEAGRRRVTLEEFLALPIILDRAGLGEVPLSDLIGTEGLAALSPGATGTGGTAVSAETLRALLSGRVIPAEDLHRTPERLDTQEVRRVGERFGVGDLSPERVYQVVLASQGGAEVHAARVLNCSPLAVALAAERTWGRSLTAERDARVDERTGLPDFAKGVDRADRRGLAHPAMIRSVQAHRGHVTRDLIEELRPIVKGAGVGKAKPKEGTR